MTGFWESCLCLFQEELPEQQFNTWIKPLRVEGESSALHEGLQVIAPNSFVLRWVKDRYTKRIESYCREFYGKPVRIHFSTGTRGSAAVDKESGISGTKKTSQPRKYTVNQNRSVKTSEAVEVTPGPIPYAQPQVQVLQPNSDSYGRTRLLPTFKFSNLVTGKANELAKAAATQVSHSPGGSYNPLFIYGSTGLGKTHLVHAIGNEIARLSPEKTVRYVHSEDYYTDVVRAYQRKAFDKLKKTYRTLDVLLIDDVHLFNGKNRTQEEFFFIFNALIESKKQIVITSDTYPKDINGLDDRLVTRFDWGLTVQIEPPETEMRVAILREKAKQEKLNLDSEVAFFIAKHLRSNVRELEGALKKVIAYASFHIKDITLEIAKEALKDIVNSTRNVSIENIQKTTADYYKIKVADFHSKNRSRAITRPRQIAMWLCKEITAKSYPVIGQAFGGRDHTTVIHAVKNVDLLRNKDNELNHDLHVLTQVLRT